MVQSLHHRIKQEAFKIRKFELKAKCLDVMGGGQIVMLNATQAQQNDIYTGYRVILRAGKRQTTAMVDLSNDLVKPGEIGLFAEVSETLSAKQGLLVELQPTSRPQSIEFIKNKLDGKALDADQMATIVHDVMDNRLSEGELSALMTACYIRDMSEDEVVGLTNAIVSTGAKFNLGRKPILDKHCIGGVAGNRTTMLIVPIMAAAGCYMPKTSSRAITSASGTADTMETLCKVTLPIPEMEKQVRAIGGCIVWGGAINLAAADDKLIKIRNPLSLDPKGVLLASIMAKKKSVGAQYCIIDIPVGRGVKMADVKEARTLAKDFISIGKRLGITVECIVTNGEDPVGHGIGPALECRDVLAVLEGDGPVDLRDKSCQMAGTLLELAGKAKKGTGFDIAQKLITNGKALTKFKQIVEWQGGETKKLNSQSIPIGNYHHRVLATNSGRISHLDNKLLARIARAAGAPLDKEAGIFLFCQKGDVLKNGQPIMDIYAQSESKLSTAIKVLENYEAVELEKMVLDSLRE